MARPRGQTKAKTSDPRKADQMNSRIVRTDEEIIDRLIEACVTGEPCKTSRSGPRLAPALSCPGLGALRDIWPEAMRKVVELGTAHPAARTRFLDTWVRIPIPSIIQSRVKNDNLFVSALRVLLPPYEGPGMNLFRGQKGSAPIGLSWTASYAIAMKFALYGYSNVDPRNLPLARVAPDVDGQLLHASVEPEDIICAPCHLGHLEGEYIVDPRKLAVNILDLGAWRLPANSRI
jgi:hypothetical protein